MSRTDLLSTTIATERDVFAVRRQGRQLASALGLESQDQVRVAAALSEVTRQKLATLGLVTVHFALDLQEDWPGPRPGTRSAAARAMLRIVAHTASVADDAFVEAVRVTRGLMDEGDVARDAAGVRVSLGRHLPERATMPSPAAIESIRAEVAALQPGTPLEELAEHINSLMCRLMPGETATMCLVALDLAEGRGLLANAGHPPPVLRTADGARLLTGSSPLLGIRIRPATEAALALDPDDLLVLYTDGLIETRTESIDANLSRLVDAVAHAETDLEAFASRLLNDVGPAIASDDIAMVALRRTPLSAEGPGPWQS